MERIHPALKRFIIDIDTLNEHPSNARQGDVGAISESLKAHGQYDPIKYRQETGEIVVGNHRWKAARALGWKKIAAVPLDIDEEEALRILLVDNRTNDLASYDEPLLIEMLKALPDLEGTGFDGDALDELIAQNGDWITDMNDADISDVTSSTDGAFKIVFDEHDREEVREALTNAIDGIESARIV
jgi:hypothetical protein